MKKAEFLSELRKKLKRLPDEETENAIEYYSEYIDDAGEENEESIIEEIGSPAHVASQILADYALNGGGKNSGGSQKGMRTIWFIILAIFASPVALPVAIVLIALLLTVVIVATSLIISFFAVAIGLFAGGLCAIFAGLAVLAESPATTLFFAGMGLVCAGFGALLFLPCILLAKKMFKGIAKGAASGLSKIRGRGTKKTAKESV